MARLYGTLGTIGENRRPEPVERPVFLRAGPGPRAGGAFGAELRDLDEKAARRAAEKREAKIFRETLEALRLQNVTTKLGLRTGEELLAQERYKTRDLRRGPSSMGRFAAQIRGEDARAFEGLQEGERARVLQDLQFRDALDERMRAAQSEERLGYAEIGQRAEEARLRHRAAPLEQVTQAAEAAQILDPASQYFLMREQAQKAGLPGRVAVPPELLQSAIGNLARGRSGKTGAEVGGREAYLTVEGRNGRDVNTFMDFLAQQNPELRQDPELLYELAVQLLQNPEAIDELGFNFLGLGGGFLGMGRSREDRRRGEILQGIEGWYRQRGAAAR